jgi:hypothetical protein
LLRENGREWFLERGCRFCSRTSCHRQRGLSEFIYRMLVMVGLKIHVHNKLSMYILLMSMIFFSINSISFYIVELNIMSWLWRS